MPFVRFVHFGYSRICFCVFFSGQKLQFIASSTLFHSGVFGRLALVLRMDQHQVASRSANPNAKQRNNVSKDDTATVCSRATSRSQNKRTHVTVQYESKSQSQSTPQAQVQIESKSKKYRLAPNNWETMLANLREMRQEHNAPVDLMGCDMCMDGDADPKDKRYQALLSLMLSSQTKDAVTYAAMQRLIVHEQGCNIDAVLAMSDEKLGELIYPVGFWKSKVRYIKETSRMLKDEYDGDIPRCVAELCKLKGVGPKMAHLCMKTAWGEVTGIGVDTHVHRIANRIGWVHSKNAEQTRKQLEDWLPQHLWQEVNHLLVGFGQQVCQPTKPQCATCLNNKICPFGIKQEEGHE